MTLESGSHAHSQGFMCSACSILGLEGYRLDEIAATKEKRLAENKYVERDWIV